MICWVAIDLIEFLVAKQKLKLVLVTGTVRSVEKNTGYHQASLKLDLQDSHNQHIKTISLFKPNLRWWVQYVPKLGEAIYFYTIEKDKRSTTTIPVFAISNRQPTGLKLAWDYFAYKSATRTILIFSILFLCLFVVMKFTPYASEIPKEFYIFILFRLVLEILII